MTKRPVDPRWFDELRTGQLRDSLVWLAPLRTHVDSLVSFGCCSSEPFALMWTLDAVEGEVVELKKENLRKPKEDLARLKQSSLVATSPLLGCMDGRSVHFIVEDMSELKEEQLRSDCCDLAYCEEVLYFMWDKGAKFQKSISQMARVVKPGGWVIACEGKIRDPYPGGDLIDISQYFLAAGLEKVSLKGAPESCGCYEKPNRPSNPSLETTVQ